MVHSTVHSLVHYTVDSIVHSTVDCAVVGVHSKVNLSDCLKLPQSWEL